MTDISFIDSIPIEVFLKLLSYISGKELVRCRAVSNRWKGIIDEITHGENFWRKKCGIDFANIIQGARYKCRLGMPWSDLYRSLSLWCKLKEANEVQDEVCPASTVDEEIKGFTILNDGTVGVHRRTSICYYDVETFQPHTRVSINGVYSRYAENDQVIVVLSCHLHLFITRKCMYTRNIYVTYDNVKIFLLLEHCIYFVDLNDDIFVVMFTDRDLTRTCLGCCTEGILTLGYRDKRLQILTLQRNVYTIVDKKLVFADMLETSNNLMHRLNEYKMLEQLDWRIYFHWMFLLNHSVPEGPLQDIITTRVYGDVIFIGSTWGVLRIYYQPYTEGEFNLFKAEPVKQYNFMERSDCPVLSMCPILKIDILEVHNGHQVYVAMPKKIAILSFTHDCYKTSKAPQQSPNCPEASALTEEAADNVKIITIE